MEFPVVGDPIPSTASLALMSDTFNGYHVWLGISPHEQPPNHYRLLGIDVFETDLDVIDHAADRQMAHVRTFQSGRNATLSQQILNELSGARLCLLSPEKKTAYDEQLRAKLAGAARATPVPMAKPLPVAQPVASTIPRAAPAVRPSVSTVPAGPNDPDNELLLDFRPASGSASLPAFPIRGKRRAYSPDDSWQRPLVFMLVAAVVVVMLLSLYGFWQAYVGPRLKEYFNEGLVSPDAATDQSVWEPTYSSPPPPLPAARPAEPSPDTP
jgi:hypothetical protein